VAGVGDMRVMRLAAAAQSAGIKTQLIIRKTTSYRDDMVRREFFDRVVWLEKWSWPWEIDTFQKSITEFGTDIVHCCLQLNTNALAAHLLATCPLPLVGDAYDMVTVQYHPQHDFAKKWYASQSVLEQLWYKNADGICFRSPYFGIMKHYNILPQKNCKITIIPEPLLEVACSRENNSVKNILLSPFSDNIEKELEMISEALNDTGINCYIIPMGITKNIKLDKRFTIIEQMPYKQYGHFLNTIDAYIQLPRSLLIYPARVKKENAYLIWRNNWSDVIERGVHLFVPEFFQYVFGYFRKTEIVHYFGKDELISHKFWSKRLIKILNCQNKPDLSRYNYINCGRKLKKFYESIVIRNN
jgi:hypothetical protein